MADQHDWDCWIGVLRANNPADPQQIDPYSDTANEILARVVATPSRQRPSRRRVMLAAAIAALVAAVATAAILLTRDVTNLTVCLLYTSDAADDLTRVEL